MKKIFYFFSKNLLTIFDLSYIFNTVMKANIYNILSSSEVFALHVSLLSRLNELKDRIEKLNGNALFNESCEAYAKEIENIKTVLRKTGLLVK